MTTLNERIMNDLKQAMRGEDTVARDALRMLRSDLGRREGELGRELEESEALEVVQKAVKGREESAQQYDEGGRGDLADKERREIEIIRGYLPEPMGEEEAREAVRAVADELGATSKKDMGRVMKTVMERHRGRIDGKLASRLAGTILQ
ncbi:MAG: GatB/YqeY domain-containing protein [Myxococcota bacterium]